VSASASERFVSVEISHSRSHSLRLYKEMSLAATYLFFFSFNLRFWGVVMFGDWEEGEGSGALSEGARVLYVRFAVPPAGQ